MALRDRIDRIKFRILGPPGFSKVLVRSFESQTYSRFCEKVYGRDLCQLNMVDEEQLQKLVSALNLSQTHSVLDLGSGIGCISEFIRDHSGATVTGIDFAKGAIKAAKKRTIGKSRLQFKAGDIGNLPRSLGLFDRIYAIDTLYFVSDLEKEVKALASHLQPDGLLAAFYTNVIQPSDSPDQLDSTKNKLARALEHAGLSFQAWDFTENEKRIWTQTLQVAEELKESFAAESNRELYEHRIREATRSLAWIKDGRIARHFYLAKIP